MMKSAVSAVTIYEKHIKSLDPKDRVELIALIARGLIAEDVVSTSKPRHSIMELHGLGKEIWEGIDAQEYVNKLRDGWDEQSP